MKSRGYDQKQRRRRCTVQYNLIRRDAYTGPFINPARFEFRLERKREREKDRAHSFFWERKKGGWGQVFSHGEMSRGQRKRRRDRGKLQWLLLLLEFRIIAWTTRRASDREKKRRQGTVRRKGVPPPFGPPRISLWCGVIYAPWHLWWKYWWYSR